MKLSVVKKKKEKLTFEITGTSVGYVNALRRIFMSYVPVMAISRVEFKQNTSTLYDEMVAHRLALISLKTDLKTYNMPKEGAEESAATHVTFTLKESGPKMVYASDLKSKDSKIVPVFPETPIVKLLEGQELEFTAVAHLGIGFEHAKWNAGLVSYYYKPKITVNNKSPKLKDFIDKYPPQIRKKDIIDADKIDSPELIDACKDVCEDIVKIEYENPPKDFVFMLESFGQLTPDQIVNEGMAQFDAMLDEFGKLTKGI